MFPNETQTFTSGGAYTDWTVQSGVSQFLRGLSGSSAVSSEGGTLRPISLVPAARRAGGPRDARRRRHCLHRQLLGELSIADLRKRFRERRQNRLAGVYTWFAEPLARTMRAVLLRRGGRPDPDAVPRCRVACSRMLGTFWRRRLDAAVRSAARRQRRPACGGLGESALRLSRGGPGEVRGAFRRRRQRGGR